MSETIKSEVICTIATSSAVLTASEAEAQTAGIERRQGDVTERSTLDRAVLEIPDVEPHDQIRR